jgi:ABC-type transport system involved in multi-copper enzyme maturation permease subunit
MHQTLTILLYTVKEALRSRLLWLVFFALLGGFGFAEFLGGIAITENRSIQAGMLGVLLRLVAVLLVGIFVIATVGREITDKGLELIMSLPINRSSYLLGKLLGFIALATIMTVPMAVLVSLYATPLSSVIWAFSLLCELILVATVALFLAMTLTNFTWAVSVLAGFYLLARSINAFLLMASGPLGENAAWLDRIMGWLLEGIAYLLPSLDLYARSEWLIYPVDGSTELVPVFIQTLIYTCLIYGAALFDLYRKNI